MIWDTNGVQNMKVYFVNFIFQFGASKGIPYMNTEPFKLSISLTKIQIFYNFVPFLFYLV